MLIEKYSSPLGEIILCAHEGALTGLWFSGQKYELRNVDNSLKETAGDRDIVEKARHWLNEYFSGKVPSLDIPLRPQGTAFQKKIWTALLTIPHGETASYGDVAKIVGCRSARAVGTAVGKNPISLIIPCHRVIGSDGSLTGYAGGIERKKALLEMERSLTKIA